MTDKGKKEQLENIFSKGETSNRRGAIFYLFTMVLTFIVGVVATYASLVYIFPFLEQKGIDLNIPVLGTEKSNPVKIIERVEQKSYVEESAVIDVVEEVSDAVVSIISKTYYRGYFGQVFSKEGGGTGFIISADGKVLTNKHVVKDTNSEYKVLTKDGQVFNVKEISLDPYSDLAVITMVDEEDEMPSALPVIKVGRSNNLKTGQRVIAIGNALGKYDNSVTIGVISATGRTILASDSKGFQEELKGLIQTDAAINPGNSGGPLLNLNGEVIGINTAVASGENIGFAIPIDDVIPVIRSIEEFGEIKRPYLGVSYRLLNTKIATLLELPITEGALLIGDDNSGVSAVEKDSPADLVGLKEGDIITEIENEKITDTTTLLDLLRNYIPNEQITLRVYRKRENLSTIDVEIEGDSTDYLDIVVTLGQRN